MTDTLPLAASVDLATARDVLIALAIGALAGIDRERQRLSGRRGTFGGLRTFILFSIAGAAAAWTTKLLDSPWVFAAVALGVCALVVAGYRASVDVAPESHGLTTEVAALCVYLLAGLAVLGQPVLAAALGILLSAALAFKEPLHGLVARLGTDDLYAGLKLLIATFVVLPLLPNHPVDPWGALNPATLWLLVILIATLSLVGYVAMRWLGPGRGLLVTGLAGGLVSSTAVTLSMSRQSAGRANGVGVLAAAAAIVGSWAVMFVRMIVAVAVVYAPLLDRVVVPLSGMALAAGAVAVALYFRHASSNVAPAVALENPFSLTQAIRFAALFAAVLLLVRFAEVNFGGEGVYVVAALAGLTDVDAITLSMAQFAAGDGDAAIAAGAIVTAAMANTIVKTGLALALAGAGMRGPIVFAFIAIAGTGFGLWRTLG